MFLQLWRRICYGSVSAVYQIEIGVLRRNGKTSHLAVNSGVHRFTIK